MTPAAVQAAQYEPGWPDDRLRYLSGLYKTKAKAVEQKDWATIAQTAAEIARVKLAAQAVAE